MAVHPWRCPQDVLQLLREIQEKNHLPRLSLASVVACFDDGKPFVRNKINLGRVTKFSELNKLWHKTPCDFCLTIPSDLWVSILNVDQREAYLDLQLTRCEVEYQPVFVMEGEKKVVVKDEWGRVQYSDQWKVDEGTGDPKWRVVPLDLEILTKNVRRYGPWLDDLLVLKEAIQQSLRRHLSSEVGVQ